PNNYHQAKWLPIYQQVFSNKNDFVPNISILDMLLNMGGREVNKLLAQPIS
ncbi:MAG: WbqC family protein, partial [Sediminibacterium sp.]